MILLYLTVKQILNRIKDDVKFLGIFHLIKRNKGKSLYEVDELKLLSDDRDKSKSRVTHNILLIIAREYKARTRTKGFLLGTTALTILAILAVCLPTTINLFYFDFQNRPTQIINNGPGNGPNDSSISSNFITDKSQNLGYRYMAFTNLEVVSPRVKEGSLNLLTIITLESTRTFSSKYYTRKDGQGNEFRWHNNFMLPVLLNRFASRPTNIQVVNSNQGREEIITNYILTLMGILLLFIITVTYGVEVAQGSIEEKNNHILEILLNALTPFQLMMGKIIGIGLAGLTQMTIVLVTGVLAFIAQGFASEFWVKDKNLKNLLDFTRISPAMLSLLIIYFLLGFWLYATLYAALGSLVNQQAEVQPLLAPLTFLLTAGYIAAVLALLTPTASWVSSLSYIPLFTPTLMLTRAGLATLAWWEIPISIFIMLTAITVFTWLAARIYRAGVLMYGQKPGILKLLKLAFQV